MIYDKTRALEPGYYDQFSMVYKPAAEKDRKDAERYRWLRERSRAYLGSNGMFMEVVLPSFQVGIDEDTCIDVSIDAGILRTTEPLLVAPPVTRVMMQMCDKCGRGVMDADECTEDDNRCPFHGGDKSLLIMRPLEVDTGIAAKTGVEIKSSHINKLNQCVDDYDLTSNDTRRGD